MLETVFVCDECVELCMDIIMKITKNAQFKKDTPKPSEINKFLDEYVIGQDDAKKSLSKHMTITTKLSNNDFSDVEISKSNIFSWPNWYWKDFNSSDLS